MNKIQVVYHSISGNTRKMAEAIGEGARGVAGTEVQVKDGLEATAEDFVQCNGIAIGSPDYFSTMAGGIKDFFDRTYYPTQGKVTGKPCVIFGNAGGPPSVVIGSLRKMADVFKLQVVAEPVGSSGSPTQEVLEECRALGRKLAESTCT